MIETYEAVRILVVDDEPAMLEIICEILRRGSYDVTAANCAALARKLLQSSEFDFILLDRKLPDGDGVALLGELRAAGCMTPALIITGYPSVKTAIQALGNCACDYILKPFEADELLSKVEQIISKSAVVLDNYYLWDSLRTRFGFDNVLSRNEVVAGCYVAAAKVAHSNASVLIQGETGTGKEYLARAIHYMSDRADKPFVPVNCGAIPEALLESELFGHEKGAFTSATSQKQGLCEIADGGTLFLDEIAEMSMEMQVKLLRFLQERRFTRLGGVKPIEVNVRIIAATNAPLSQIIEAGKFREDLYYRLNVVPLFLPKLAERPDDVLIFARHFIDRHAGEGSARKYTISPNAEAILQNYAWPGNLRELENVMRRTLLIADSGRIEPHHLMLGDLSSAPNYLRALSRGSDEQAQPATAPRQIDIQPIADNPFRDLESLEREHIIHVLDAVDGNKTKAAEILGIARKTLRAKLDKYQIEDKPVAA